MTDCTCSHLQYPQAKSHEITPNLAFVHKRLQICDNCKFVLKERQNELQQSQNRDSNEGSERKTPEIYGYKGMYNIVQY